MMPIHHIVTVSGGKDSNCCYLLAMEYAEKKGFSFRAISADTGNEHEATDEYIRTLHEKTGGPKVEIIKQDFTARIAAKREVVKTKWRLDGVSESIIDAALGALHPTGIPFLDLVLWKGRFPSCKAKFCTEHLKIEPTNEQIIQPLLDNDQRVLRWVGIRRDESRKRQTARRFERDPFGTGLDENWIYRPLVNWTADDVFALHRRHGLKPNPLYYQGCGRVGCLPCINVTKPELRNIALRWPEHIERVDAWERLAGLASKRGVSSFFSVNKTPGDHQRDSSLPIPMILDVVQWAKTGKGGKNFDIIDYLSMQDPPQCASFYGLCGT